MKKLVSALAIAASMLVGASQASASIVVDFSFTGFPTEPGTVTGHLVFDAAGTDVHATGVYFDSATRSIDGYQGYNFLNGAQVFSNLFTIAADGTVSAANLYLTNTASYANIAKTWIQLNAFGGYNNFEQDYTGYFNGGYFTAVENQGGFNGVTFSAAPVPEPAAWAMLTIGFGLIGGAIRRRKAIVSFA